MVVLQEDECPIETGLTPAESTLRHFWGCGYYRHQLTAIPDLPAIWPTLAIQTVYLDPELARLGLGYAVPDGEMIYHDPTIEGEYHDRVEELLLWLTRETAARTVFQTGDPGTGVVVRVSGDQIIFTVDRGIRVVSNHPLITSSPISQVSLDPEWSGAQRPSLYPEHPGTEVYYVKVDGYGLEHSDQVALQRAYPGELLSLAIPTAEYLGELSEPARVCLQDRWGSCGICEETVDWCYVYGCCQYPVCSGCLISYLEEHDEKPCPHCREAKPHYHTLAEEPSPLVSPVQVYQAIISQSPGAHVVLLADPDHHRWGVRPVECRISLISGVGDDPSDIKPQLLDQHLSATHVISLVPDHHIIPYIRPGGDAPLQVYYLGPGWCSPIRAAAKSGSLHYGTIPVRPVEYHPIPGIVLSRMTREMPGWIRDTFTAVVCQLGCLYHNGRFLDLDLEAVARLARGYQDEHRYNRRRRATRLAVTEKSETWYDGDRLVAGISPTLRVGDTELCVRELWAALDSSRRRRVEDDLESGDEDASPEPSSEESE